MPQHPTTRFDAPAPRPTHLAWVEVDLGALIDNARELRRAIPPSTRLGLLVKANAYGHGLEMAARAALTGGAELLVVAAVSEAFALRAAGIRAPILVVYPTHPEQVVDAVNEGIELSVGGRESVDATLRAWAACRDRSALMRLHVEVDTGMGRGGVPPEDLVEVVTRIDGEPATELAGVWSHLSDGSDPDRSAAQVARFEEALAEIAAIGRRLPVRHVAATEGLLVGTAPPYEMVRIGLAWYGELGLGVEPTPKLAGVADRLRPALRVVARPVRIADVDVATSIGYGGEWTANRPSRIATLPIGYADGIARSSWPGGCAVANGRRVPIVGRISMDSLSVDVTDAGEVTMDSEVVLLGAQDAERISVNEVARQRGTIPNEVLSTLGARLPRRYLGVDRLREPDS